MANNESNLIKVPIEVSARHIHLTPGHLQKLFGEGYELKKFKELSQPGQFSAEETVAIKGPRGSLEKVRVIGPCRDHTQVEISKTDARILGLEPPVRESSKIENSSPISIIGPESEIELSEGAIIAQRHIHADPETAESAGIKSGDIVSVKIDGQRGLIFDDVIVRVDKDFKLAFQIDTDEANAAGVDGGNNLGLLIIAKQ